MLESTAGLRLQPPGALADVLIGLITDIRRVLIHPDLGNDQKLTEVFALVDEAAPPPPAGRPQTGG